MSSAPAMRRPDEIGVPDPFPLMHPLMVKNYGAWAWHDRPRPGVLHHVAKSGDEIWTVRAGTQRQMDIFTIRKLCDIADQFAEGHVRFTTRSNIEFMVADQSKVAPLIDALGKEGFPIGGTGNSVSMISHTQGWLHCDIPGTDASGVVKSLMDMMHHEFINEEMPNRVRITTSCCQINCGGQGDISINVQYTKPPKINHDLVVEGLRTAGRRRALPGRRHSSGHGRRQAVAGSRRAEMRVLRRLLSALPADADQRRGFDQDRRLGRRQALQRPLQADVPQAGRRQSAQQCAALAGSRAGREERSFTPTRTTPGITSAWASGSSASAGRASSK